MRLVPTRSSIRRFRTEVDPRTLSNGIEFTLQSPRVDGNYFSGLVSSPEEKTTERIFIAKCHSNFKDPQNTTRVIEMKYTISVTHVRIAA